MFLGSRQVHAGHTDTYAGNLLWCKVRENGRNAWTIKAAIVLCSLCLGNPAGRCERWQKGRSETAAVTRLDISWLKPLVLLVPVEQRVPHKMHMHMWCGTVDRVYKR